MCDKFLIIHSKYSLNPIKANKRVALNKRVKDGKNWAEKNVY